MALALRVEAKCGVGANKSQITLPLSWVSRQLSLHQPTKHAKRGSMIWEI